MNQQGRILGFKLAEVNLDGCFPYEFYAASRFRQPTPEEIMEYIEQQSKIEEKEEVFA